MLVLTFIINNFIFLFFTIINYFNWYRYYFFFFKIFTFLQQWKQNKVYFVFYYVLFRTFIQIIFTGLKAKQFYLFFFKNFKLPLSPVLRYEVRYFFNFPLAAVWLFTTFVFFIGFWLYLFCVFTIIQLLVLSWRILYFFGRRVAYVLNWYKFFIRRRYYIYSMYSFVKYHFFILITESPIASAHQVFLLPRSFYFFLYY